MSQTKGFLKLEYLNRKRIIYRRNPITDIPTDVYNWGWYYKDGTHECYELFRSSAKINTFRSLKWHLLVLWYLNPQLSVNDFENLANFIADKKNEFVTFVMLNKYLTNMIYDVTMCDLEEPPKNKLRKVIFKDITGLTMNEKLVIVGQLIGRDKLVDEDMIYQCMLDLHELGKKITVTGLARLLNCSPRTIYRTLSNDLKREKELLNKNNEKI
tara:strand:- start:425 stop:1063 length:639 start_codon:yes stop_codon:yes gene_type:complete